jgi:hypothetical protein
LKGLFLFLINKIDKILTVFVVLIFVFKFGIILIIFVGIYLFSIVSDISDEFKFKKSLLFLLSILVLSGIKNIIRYFIENIQ